MDRQYKHFQDFLEQNGFDYRNLCVRLDGGAFSLIDLDISPMQFLMQAEKDFNSQDGAFYLNCITNAKRAILCQMDQILVSFGFSSFRWNVVKKIDVLNNLGVLTPPVLRKVSRVRNLLEHEYSKPSKEDVELALDIATLFVLSNKALFNAFESNLVMGLDTSSKDLRGDYISYIAMELVREQSVYWQIYARIESRLVASWKMYNNDPFFCSLIKLCTSFQLDYRSMEALDELNLQHENYSQHS